MSEEVSGGSNLYRVGFFVLLGVCLIMLFSNVILAGCESLLSSEPHELERVASPDGRTDAVLVNPGSFQGATGGGYLELFLVPSGEEAKDLPNEKRSLFVEELDPEIDDGRYIDEGLDLRWRGEKVLEIRYKAAQISDFQNYGYVENEKGGSRMIELRFIPPNDLKALPNTYYPDEVLNSNGNRKLPTNRMQILTTICFERAH